MSDVTAIEIIAVIRDVAIISVLLVAILMMLLVFWKVTSVLSSIKRTMENVQQVTSELSDKIVKPATAGSGVAFGLGKLASFIRGASGGRKRKGGKEDG